MSVDDPLGKPFSLSFWEGSEKIREFSNWKNQRQYILHSIKSIPDI